jgi:hypothetical protein
MYIVNAKVHTIPRGTVLPSRIHKPGLLSVYTAIELDLCQVLVRYLKCYDMLLVDITVGHDQ